MGITRRGFVSLAAGIGFAGDKGQPIPPEVHRYADQATDLPLARLTDPSHESWLSACYNPTISRRGDSLIYSSDRSGTVQAYRMDLKTGQSHGLTEAKALASESLTLSPDERNIYFVDGGSLFASNLASQRQREVYRAADGFELATTLCLSGDGLYAALVERKAGRSRLRLITTRTGAAVTVTESGEAISDAMPRPKRAGLLYRLGSDALWQVNFDGAQNRRLRVAPGGVGTALWSSDGRSVLYLSVGAEPGRLTTIREYVPDTNEDRFVSKTSQFTVFNHNGDSSVFVGASGSKASPYVLLLVRSVQRELALCEHRASDPRKVTAFFSPNSQRIFFQSDRDGKMAIYSMAVDKLVGETESEPPDQR